MDQVLVTCQEGNIASQKIILNNGGVLENTVTTPQGETFFRYWVKL